MSKELEALNKIGEKWTVCWNNGLGRSNQIKELDDYKIIEAVLKNEDSEKFGLIQQVRELKDDVASLESCNSKLWIEKEEYKKAIEIVDLMIKKGVNIVLLNYLYHINPDHAFETYNKEMRKNWCDLYELNSEQFNRIVDYLKEQKHETRRN